MKISFKQYLIDYSDLLPWYRESRSSDLGGVARDLQCLIQPMAVWMFPEKTKPASVLVTYQAGRMLEKQSEMVSSSPTSLATHWSSPPAALTSLSLSAKWGTLALFKKRLCVSSEHPPRCPAGLPKA